MNASSLSNANIVEDRNNSGSDSDASLDLAPQHYQPISAVDDEDIDPDNSDEEHYSYSRSNAENGISSIQLNGDVEEKSSSDGEDEDEEVEERIPEESDSAILTAFREDENRRNAPLTAENATRVREAMRGISFGGSAPDWVGRVPENQWIHQLRQLRQPPRPPASVQ